MASGVASLDDPIPTPACIAVHLPAPLRSIHVVTLNTVTATPYLATCRRATRFQDRGGGIADPSWSGDASAHVATIDRRSQAVCDSGTGIEQSQPDVRPRPFERCGIA